MDPKGSIVEDLKKGDSNSKLINNTGYVWWKKISGKSMFKKMEDFTVIISVQ